MKKFIFYLSVSLKMSALAECKINSKPKGGKLHHFILESFHKTHRISRIVVEIRVSAYTTVPRKKPLDRLQYSQIIKFSTIVGLNFTDENNPSKKFDGNYFIIQQVLRHRTISTKHFSLFMCI